MAHLALTGDFAMPNRADCMSLATINKKQDQVGTSTSKFGTIRNTSNNLNTGDIEGKYFNFCSINSITVLLIIFVTRIGAVPKLHGSK